MWAVNSWKLKGSKTRVLMYSIDWNLPRYLGKTYCVLKCKKVNIKNFIRVALLLYYFTGIYHSAGKCLSNGRCLCWWGWTGSGACYVYGGTYNNRIIVSVNLIGCRPSKTNKQTHKQTQNQKNKQVQLYETYI